MENLPEQNVVESKKSSLFSNKKMLIPFIAVLVVAIVITGYFMVINHMANDAYDQATKAMAVGNYDVAISSFEKSLHYKKSKITEEKIASAKYERDAVKIINDLYAGFQNVRDKSYSVGSRAELTALCASIQPAITALNEFPANDSPVGKFIGSLKGNALYRLYCTDYLTGKVFNNTYYIDSIIFSSYKMLAREISTSLCNIKRPEQCLYGVPSATMQTKKV